MRSKKLVAILGVMILAGSSALQAQQGFGTNKPHPSAAVDITSTTKGFLPPRMTSDDIQNIVDPANGLVVYNTDEQCLQYCSNGKFSCAFETPAKANTAPTFGNLTNVAAAVTVGFQATATATYYDADGDVPGTHTYQWYRFNSISGGEPTEILNATASAYTFTTDDLGKYIVVGVTPYATTGLSPGFPLFASSRLGPVAATGCGPLIVTHTAGSVAPVTKTVTYETVTTGLGGTGTKCWITQNLGADRQATSATDASIESAGWYWQHNRLQGYQYNGTASPTWNANENSSQSWLPANDPCHRLLGAGWRLPTSQELLAVTSGIANSTDAYTSLLRLHLAGLIENGVIQGYGSYGCVLTIDCVRFYYAAGAAGILTSTNYFKSGNYNRAYGTSTPIRCLKDL